jgi:hypothetical protein
MMMFFWVLAPFMAQKPSTLGAEDGNSMFLRNVAICQQVDTAPNPEEHHHHPHCRGNLKSHRLFITFYSVSLLWRLRFYF